MGTTGWWCDLASGHLRSSANSTLQATYYGAIITIMLHTTQNEQTAIARRQDTAGPLAVATPTTRKLAEASISRQHPPRLPRRPHARRRMAGGRPAYRRRVGRLPRRDLRGGPRARNRRPRRRRRPVSGQARSPARPRRGSDRARVGRLPSHGRRQGQGPGRPAESGRARRDSRHRRTSPH